MPIQGISLNQPQSRLIFLHLTRELLISRESVGCDEHHKT
jgi:hypothetical protein